MAENRPAFGKTPAAGASAPGRKSALASTGFWHRPEWMNLVSDLMIVVAAVALGYAAVKAVLRLPSFGLREVVVTSPLSHVTTEQIEYAAASSLRGNFFTVDLDQARKAFENLPWVRRAQLRRHWPARVEIELEEHVAMAYWRSADSSDTRLVNSFGELFDAASNAEMPVFSGPAEAGKQMLSEVGKLDETLKPVGRKTVALTLSGRRAWQMKLDDGTLIELGRDQPDAPAEDRLARFVKYWSQTRERLNKPIMVADLRYPNGFSARIAEGEQQKGKQ